MKNYIEGVIKPKLQGDGGEIDFVSLLKKQKLLVGIV